MNVESDRPRCEFHGDNCTKPTPAGFGYSKPEPSADTLWLEWKHLSYNPIEIGFGFNALLVMCEKAEVDGWALHHIVSNGQYNAIAVFSRPAHNDGSSEAT